MKTIKIHGVVTEDIVDREDVINLKVFEDSFKDIKTDVLVDFSTIGGDVFEAIKIFNFVENWQVQNNKKISFFINGIVASAGTYIAMAGHKVYIADNSIFMIHSAKTLMFGDNNDFFDASQRLEKTNKLIVSAYEKKTNKSTNDFLELIKKDSYFYGDEILNFGFADAFLSEEYKNVKKLKNEFDVKGINNVLISNLKKDVFARSNGEHLEEFNLKKERVLKMSLDNYSIEDLKKENIELYNSIYNSGFSKGLDRAYNLVESHLSWATEGVPTEKIVNNIKNRVEFNSKIHSDYAMDLHKKNLVNDLGSDLPVTPVTKLAKDTDLVKLHNDEDKQKSIVKKSITEEW